MNDIKKMKVMTVIGTRPEIIKLSETIKELDRYTDHVLVHTGQNYDYELNEIFFKDLGLRKPNHFLNVAGASASVTVGNVISKLDDILEKEKPDAFLILGDTNSCMGMYAAKRRKIPIFHIEAGNRCFDMRVPEELNRRVIDHTSDINLVYSDVTRHNLLREGLPMDRIIKIGSPVFEVLSAHKKEIRNSTVVKDMALREKDYFVLSAHREENINIESNFKKFVDIINRVSSHYDKPIIFSVHPRTRKRLEEEKITLPKNVKATVPLGFFDYVNLQMNAFCVLSDSGTISEESSMLNFPGINIRDTNERLEAMDEASVIMTGLDPDRVLQAIEIARDKRRGDDRDFIMPVDYGNINVSKKVVRIIVSYVNYVKRTVWSEF